VFFLGVGGKTRSVKNCRYLAMQVSTLPARGGM